MLPHSSTTPRVYSRRKSAEKPPQDAVYVGRGTPFGNPFVIGKDGTREDVIRAYREWLTYQPALRERMRRELRGKHLACWCAPEACHADVILEVANSELGYQVATGAER